MGGDSADRRPLRVLLVHRDLAFHGGVPRASLTYARFRDPASVDLHLLVLTPPDADLVAEFTRTGATVHAAPATGYVGAARFVRALLRERAIDVVVATAFRPYLVAKIATAGLRLPVLLWIQSIPKVIEGRVRRALFRRLARRDDLIFISRAVAATHMFPAFAGRMRVVLHGIVDPRGVPDLEPYGSEYRRELRIPEGAVVLGYVAEFIDWKDHKTLLRAFSAVASRLPEAYLMLIGTGGGKEGMQRLAATLPGGDRVLFLGARPDARRLFGVMDLYVHPSRGEGFGLAVAEAMAAEVPVIAADEGALPEFVLDGETGLLFRAGDEQSLADRILYLLERRELAGALAAKGRAYCLKHFSPARFAAELTSFVAEGVRK